MRFLAFHLLVSCKALLWISFLLTLTFCCCFAAPMRKAFDTAHWLCTSPVNMSDLHLQFFQVEHFATPTYRGNDKNDHASTSSPSENAIKMTTTTLVDEQLFNYLILDVTAWNDVTMSSPHKWCIFQLDTSPEFPHVVMNWACDWQRIVEMCRFLFATGNLRRVTNVTNTAIRHLRDTGNYNVSKNKDKVGTYIRVAC